MLSSSFFRHKKCFCFQQIAVPRGCTLEGMKFTQEDCETHTLTMVDDRPTAFITANGKVFAVYLFSSEYMVYHFEQKN